MNSTFQIQRNQDLFNQAWKEFDYQTKLAVESKQHPVRVITAADITVDLSLQHHSSGMASAVKALLEACHLDDMRKALFKGYPINWTEARPALHTALRQSPSAPLDIEKLIKDSLESMRNFVDKCNSNNLYRNIVHLGIGGSDWGPRMVWESLKGRETRRTLRFAANVDAEAITTALDGLDPQDTLLVLASKSFTTVETMTNARYALNWMREGGVQDPLRQTVALTANVDAAKSFGISDDHIFEFWDWVGGRYSVWSSIGLSLALTLGWNTFVQLLEGARAMDNHFMNEPFEMNAPVQMAISAVANTSVLGYTSQVICPYDARLAGFVMWLQQLEMESLGKSVDFSSKPVKLKISPAVWGMPGTDSQHTFFQWLHQDQQGAPVDFIIRKYTYSQFPEHHRLLLANCLAQRAALWKGKTLEEVSKRLAAEGKSQEEIAKLAPHLVHPGKRPSTLIVLPSLNPFALGALLALYEQKVFVQSVLWGINPFDQWGVEFGKRLAKQMLEPDALEKMEVDDSTLHWIKELNISKQTHC